MILRNISVLCLDLNIRRLKIHENKLEKRLYIISATGRLSAELAILQAWARVPANRA